MLGIGEIFGESVSEVRMELYFRALADLPLPDLSTALQTLVQTSKFFPRPAEIREALTGSIEDQAELAWVGLLRLVRRRGWVDPPATDEWPDPAMRRAALELYGGWQALCELLPCEGPGFTMAAKQFKATYASYARREAGRVLPSRASAVQVGDGS